MLAEIDKAIQYGDSFAFETTLSGKTYAKKIVKWREKGYSVVMYYIFVDNCETSDRRIEKRVKQGGHNIPTDVVFRRFNRSQANFDNIYKKLVDKWYLIKSHSNMRFYVVEKSQ